jgi:hypothetical protein
MLVILTGGYTERGHRHVSWLPIIPLLLFPRRIAAKLHSTTPFDVLNEASEVTSSQLVMLLPVLDKILATSVSQRLISELICK